MDRFGGFGMLSLPLGVQKVIEHPVQPSIKNPLGIRGELNHACFNFTGSNYATINALSTNLIGGGGSFTISWRQFAGISSGAERPVFTVFGNGNNFVTMWEPRATDSNEVIYSFVNANNVSTVVALLTFESWDNRYLTYTVADKKIRLYKNGVLVKTTVASATTFASVSTTALVLGANASGTASFLGRLSDIRLYSAVVTPNHSVAATSESNLVAWYPYPNTSGVARDCSGNGNHMTTSGGTLYSLSGGPGLPWDWVLV